MRLWHEDLIPHLPGLQLNGQHRELCALRGNGWGKKHSTVQYVFGHSFIKLWQYHMLILAERDRRGYNYNKDWVEPAYRGRNCPLFTFPVPAVEKTKPVYKEHNDLYLESCLENIHEKISAAPIGKYNQNDIATFYRFYHKTIARIKLNV